MGAAAFALSLVIAPSAFAKGDNGKGNDDHRPVPSVSHHDDGDDDRNNGGEDNHLTCPNKQILVRIDEKLCPDKPGRPAVVRKRACCRHGDTTNCHPFHPCPPNSRS
jgi:hypothetical protein